MIYAQQKLKTDDESDLRLCRLIDEEFTRYPFYGSRKMVVFLKVAGHTINRKRVQRLMRQIGLAAIAPGPNTSRPHPEHKIYPYLVAIIDWYSRRVLSWRISNSMEAVFCVDCLEEALRNHGKPAIFNSDQGSQFTSASFTGVLQREGVLISMDGRGRAFDNKQPIATHRVKSCIRLSEHLSLQFRSHNALQPA
jgi:putative transposase